MIPNSTPQELLDLENRLRTRRDPQPTLDLRNRVMQAVALELSMHHPSPPARQYDVQFWLAAAAAVLLVLNLSMIAASEQAFSVHSRSVDQYSSELRALQQIEAQQEGIFK